MQGFFNGGALKSISSTSSLFYPIAMIGQLTLLSVWPPFPYTSRVKLTSRVSSFKLDRCLLCQLMNQIYWTIYISEILTKSMSRRHNTHIWLYRGMSNTKGWDSINRAGGAIYLRAALGQITGKPHQEEIWLASKSNSWSNEARRNAYNTLFTSFEILPTSLAYMHIWYTYVAYMHLAYGTWLEAADCSIFLHSLFWLTCRSFIPM